MANSKSQKVAEACLDKAYEVVMSSYDQIRDSENSFHSSEVCNLLLLLKTKIEQIAIQISHLDPS